MIPPSLLLGDDRNDRHHPEELTVQWTKPAFTDLRFGFEITMYIANR